VKNDVNELVKKENSAFLPVMIALVLIVGSVLYIAFRTMSNRAHAEKWKDYDECGLF
jgi:flagellar basal body-associated protein FliL